MSTVRRVEQALAATTPTPPPIYIATAQRLGWQPCAERINRWYAAGSPGHWSDSEFDDGFDGGDPS